MKTTLLILTCLLTYGCFGQEASKPVSIKSVLLQQLENTHTQQEWFVPINDAVKELSAKQANWKDHTGNHSIAELVSHMIFWNKRVLRAFKGDTLTDFDNDNEVTFKQFKEEDWMLAIKKLDSIQMVWKESVEQANEEHLLEWSFEIANMCAHNAYHTGQIVYIRKKKGWWDQNME